MKGRRLALGLVLCAGVWFLALPEKQRSTSGSPARVAPVVRGAMHIHTLRSDGTGTLDDVAAAAARAGLRFVVVTDHGDGTREPEPPSYRSGVLCLEAVEISTDGGHVVAIGLTPSPYPLAGQPQDVIEDVHRLGGLALAAHPASEKSELAFTGWAAGFDGIEWLNGDSEWRNESPWSLARVLLTYPWSRQEALATLLDRPDALMARWDTLTSRRRVVAVAGADAHARIGLRSVGEPYDSRLVLRSPSYEAMFRTFSVALAGVVLTGEAATDGPALVDALREGRVYSTIDALAAPATMAFSATSGSAHAIGGERLRLEGPITFRVDVQAPPDARISLLAGGKEIASATGAVLEHTAAGDPGAYRVEVLLPGSPGNPPVPWIVSNPIYAGMSVSDEGNDAVAPIAGASSVRSQGGAVDAWRVESSERSVGAINVVSGREGLEQIVFRFGLGGRQSENPFVAMVMPAGDDLSQYDRLTFTARASRPMRASVQLRRSGSGGDPGDRWQKSVFVDVEPRELTVYFKDMVRPRAGARTEPNLRDVDTVLFVIDTVNTPTGSNGQMWIDGVTYAR